MNRKPELDTATDPQAQRAYDTLNPYEQAELIRVLMHTARSGEVPFAADDLLEVISILDKLGEYLEAPDDETD